MISIHEELEYLFEKGFRQEFPNDPEYPHLSFRLDVKAKSPVLDKIFIELSHPEDSWILDVYCIGIDEEEAHLKKIKYSHRALEDLLKYLKC